MKLNIINHSFHYEMEKLTRIFFPHESITVLHEKDETGDYISTEILNDGVFVTASLFGKTAKKTEKLSDSTNSTCTERRMAVLLYEVLGEITSYTPEWGILTGVRPAKLMSTLCCDKGEKEAVDIFKNELKVNEEKTGLAFKVAKKEKAITDLSKPNSFSIYISVPFCPTRCSYCSFVSEANDKAKKLIPEYVDRLCEEIEYTGRLIKPLGLRLETVYYGGGTPTTLCAEDLRRIHNSLQNSFDLSTVREYTVEAGRPDTVTDEKLLKIQSMGAGRISINPQSFNDDVLKAIGRNHSSEQTIEAFKMARKNGFNNINMDLIAGLPEDTLESFKKSLCKAIELDTESITVHTLALKRSSAIVTEKRKSNSSFTAAQMLSFAYEALSNNGYEPYYMYRQTRCLGNYENVGWTKKGFECLYNVYMMEETHSVISFGAGGVTKLRNPYSTEIERVFNFKYPYEYIGNFQQILDRKKQITDFYSKINRGEQ